jgi:hypothetical protein
MTQREDESLIDEMREAIRAQRERAAARAPKPPADPPAEPPSPAPAAPEPPKSRFRRLLGR